MLIQSHQTQSHFYPLSKHFPKLESTILKSEHFSRISSTHTSILSDNIRQVGDVNHTLTALCLEVSSAGLRSCSPFSVSLDTSSSDSSQDEENPAEEAEDELSFLRERVEECDPGMGLELGLGVRLRPWSEA